MNKYFTSNISRFLVCSFHAFILLLITWFWLDSIWIRGDEKSLIKWSSVIRKSLLNRDEKPSVNDFVFIDLAWDKELIPREDGLGEQVITNRERLAKIFNVLKKYPGQYKYIICDVFFQGDSPNDSILQASFVNLKNIIVPSHMDGNELLKPKFNVPTGLADYTTTDDSFLKYKLDSYDSLKSLPLKMYEDVTGATFQKKNLFLFSNGRPSFNSMIIDYRITNNDLSGSDESDTSNLKYPVYPLSELLLFPDSLMFYSYLKDKYVVIGNFKEDVHSTVLGTMPGTLILLNIYLSLLNGENLVSIYWVLILLTGYFILSWMMFFPFKIISPKLLVKILDLRFFTFITSTFYLTILSIISYIYFNVQIGILIIAVYMNTFIYIVNHYKEIKEKITNFRFKHIKEYLKENLIGSK